MFWKSVARWISQAPTRGNALKASVLHRPRQTVLLACDLRQLRERVEVDLHVGQHLAVRSHEPAVRGPRLHADLAQADEAAATAAVVAVHERAQLVHVRVLPTHLADFAADRDGHALRLALPDERGELRGQLVVRFLLLVQRALAEVHQRRGVDVDVEEARLDFLRDQLADGVRLLVAVGTAVFLRVDLHVVALDEQRPPEAFPKRGSQHDGRVLGRALLGVAHFRPGDLQDERTDVQLVDRAHQRAPRVVDHHPDVDRGHREPARLVAAHGHVEVVNGGGPDALGGRKAANQPACAAGERRVAGEHCGPRQMVDDVARDRTGPREVHAIGHDRGDILQRVGHLFHRLVHRHATPRREVSAVGNVSDHSSPESAAGT
jgi:hypothetical protein